MNSENNKIDSGANGLVAEELAANNTASTSILQGENHRSRMDPGTRIKWNLGGDSPELARMFADSGHNTPQHTSDDEDTIKQDKKEDLHMTAIRTISREPKQPIQSHEVLVELYDLHYEKGNIEWQETARWMKYEEDAEGVNYHWGKPHVAFLSFHALIQIRKCLARGVLLMDLDVENFEHTCQLIASAMSQKFKIDQARTNAILATLKRTHKHVHDHSFRLPRMATHNNLENQRSFFRQSSHAARLEDEVVHKKSFVEMARDMVTKRRAFSSAADANAYDERPRKQSFLPGLSTLGSFALSQTTMAEAHEADSLLKKLPVDVEAAQVFVGVLKELQRARFAMVRLADSVFMPELVESPIPIRFLFVILGPETSDIDYHELGRSIATLMSNSHFHDIAYAASGRGELVAAIDKFLDESIVIPPGEVDSKKLLSVDQLQKALKKRQQKIHPKDGDKSPIAMDSNATKNGVVNTASIEIGGGEKKEPRNPLVRSGRLFGGLIDDIKRRLPFYWSDFKDIRYFQCITSIVFMFFASFAPAITFGGLMSSYTDDYMGPTETLLAQCLCGVIWGIFSVQPLLIMSATGPVLIFEGAMYNFCQQLGLNFLTIRVWAGIWLMLIAFITVMLEGSFLLRYVSRFTEDIFATLISAIFIAESVKFVVKTFKTNPVVNLENYWSRLETCSNGSSLAESDPVFDIVANDSVNLINYNNISTPVTSVPDVCLTSNQPDTALLTASLLLATFVLAYIFKQLRSSVYFGRTLRQMIGDFGVLISIAIVSLFEYAFFGYQVALARLDMPKEFGFTSPEKRNGQILINFLLPSDQWWGYFFALLPAFLVYILLFVETEITELLLAKKERGMRKGSGFHWDLMLVGVLSFVCSLLGLPWMCAAAVQSLAHANSLTVMKRHVPGARPQIDFVIEQRVTTICVALLVGACAFGGKLLSFLPMAVLFGVFLYLGVMNLVGVQFVRRLVLLLIPEKYFPNESYCQKVQMGRMHLFTGLQLLCLFGVYLVKFFKSSALVFPFILMMCCVIRVLALPFVFTQPELSALDAHEDYDEDDDDIYDLITIPL